MIIYEEIFKKYGLSLTQQKILKIVGEGKVILEIGAATGYMTRAFLDNHNTVDVVETNTKAAAKIPTHTRQIFNISIEDQKIIQLLAKDYDYIIMADVLEHLVNPEQALKSLLKAVSADAKLLISLPNMASWVIRKQLFFKGDFQYQESGILDRTHLHFYTVLSLPRLLLQNGWKTEKVIGTITRFPLEGLVGKIPVASWVFKKIIYPKLVEKFPNLAYYHFLTVASKK